MGREACPEALNARQVFGDLSMFDAVKLPQKLSIGNCERFGRRNEPALARGRLDAQGRDSPVPERVPF